MSRLHSRPLAALLATSVLLVGVPQRAHAWNTGKIAPTPAVTDQTWMRSLPTHQWIMWQAIEYLRRWNHPLAELYARNFDALAAGNHYADHHCDADVGDWMQSPGAYPGDERLGREIVQTVEVFGVDQKEIRSCADVVAHFPRRPEVGHVEEIWDDTMGEDIFSPQVDAQEYAERLMPLARAFLPGWHQSGRPWSDTQPQLDSLPWVYLGSFRPFIDLTWFDDDPVTLGSVRPGSVPRQDRLVWPSYVNPAYRDDVAPQKLQSSMFYLGWAAHMVGDSAQIYHRQRSSGPFHGGYEGDVDAMIKSGAFDSGVKKYPVARQRILVARAYAAQCGFDPPCWNDTAHAVASMSEAELYQHAGELGVAAPQTQCAIPFDYEASTNGDETTPNAYIKFFFDTIQGFPLPSAWQIVDQASGPSPRAPKRCQEWANRNVWLDYDAAVDLADDYLQDPEPVFFGQEPSHQMLAAYAADNLSRAVTTTAVLFAIHGDALIASSGGSPAVFDGDFYASANPGIAARAGGTSRGALMNDWLSLGLREARPSSPAFDLRHYVAMMEDPIGTSFDPEAAPRHLGTLQATDSAPAGGTSPAFNPSQYRALNPSLASMSPTAAMRHFSSTGVDAGMVGSVFFDPRAYKARYGDVASLTSRGALAHWLSNGLSAARAGSHGFDPNFYLNVNGDVASAVASDPTRALRHFAAWGIGEGRQSSPAYDPSFYGAVYRKRIDLSGVPLSLRGRDLVHFQRSGIDEGLMGSPAFDPVYYRTTHTSLNLASDRAALDQWMTTGIKEARASSLFFDVAYYRANNADLASTYQRLVWEPLLRRYVLRPDYQALTWHWLRTGIGEQRRGSAGFDAAYYLNANADVASSCSTAPRRHLCAMAHYVRIGRGQGRAPVAP